MHQTEVALSNPEQSHRAICSFARRQGRITQRQRLALTQLWPHWGIAYQSIPHDLNSFFKHRAPIILEIGFGMGHSLVEMAKSELDKNFLGIEVYLPGIGACMAQAEQEGITNLRIINHDAVAVLENMIPDNILSGVQIFFPDPWHKVRHHKRRLIQANFLTLLHRKLKLNGWLHIATDWQHYAEQILLLLESTQGYLNSSAYGEYHSRLSHRPITKFEQRGQKFGHNIQDIIFTKSIIKN